jgi:hypothetical protein
MRTAQLSRRDEGDELPLSMLHDIVIPNRFSGEGPAFSSAPLSSMERNQRVKFLPGRAGIDRVRGLPHAIGKILRAIGGD